MVARIAPLIRRRNRFRERPIPGRRGPHGYRDDVPARVLRRQVSVGVVVWIVVGLVVAARHDFLDDLGSLSHVLSAVLAVIVWPLVLLDVHFGI